MKRQKLKRDASDYKRHYDKNSDDDDAETELLTRKVVYQEPPSAEKDIEEGDTLQALSIRYHCSVAELKRLNHIINDNEIFAKRTIKVPPRPFAEILAGVHVSGQSSPRTKMNLESEVDADLLDSKLHTFLNVSGDHDDLSSFNEVIFNSKILSKSCDVASDDEADSVNEEEINLIPNAEVQTADSAVVSQYFCSDADISWIALFCCVVIIIFAAPIIYVMYLAEHHNSTHLLHHPS